MTHSLIGLRTGIACAALACALMPSATYAQSSPQKMAAVTNTGGGAIGARDFDEVIAEDVATGRLTAEQAQNLARSRDEGKRRFDEQWERISKDGRQGRQRFVEADENAYQFSRAANTEDRARAGVRAVVQVNDQAVNDVTLVNRGVQGTLQLVSEIANERAQYIRANPNVSAEVKRAAEAEVREIDRVAGRLDRGLVKVCDQICRQTEKIRANEDKIVQQITPELQKLRDQYGDDISKWPTPPAPTQQQQTNRPQQQAPQTNQQQANRPQQQAPQTNTQPTRTASNTNTTPSRGTIPQDASSDPAFNANRNQTNAQDNNRQPPPPPPATPRRQTAAERLAASDAALQREREALEKRRAEAQQQSQVKRPVVERYEPSLADGKGEPDKSNRPFLVTEDTPRNSKGENRNAILIKPGKGFNPYLNAPPLQSDRPGTEAPSGGDRPGTEAPSSGDGEGNAPRRGNVPGEGDQRRPNPTIVDAAQDAIGAGLPGPEQQVLERLRRQQGNAGRGRSGDGTGSGSGGGGGGGASRGDSFAAAQQAFDYAYRRSTNSYAVFETGNAVTVAQVLAIYEGYVPESAPGARSGRSLSLAPTSIALNWQLPSIGDQLIPGRSNTLTLPAEPDRFRNVDWPALGLNSRPVRIQGRENPVTDRVTDLAAQDFGYGRTIWDATHYGDFNPYGYQPRERSRQAYNNLFLGNDGTPGAREVASLGGFDSLDDLLSNESARDVLRSILGDRFDELAELSVNGRGGLDRLLAQPFNVILTWGSGAFDLDLHLTGPDGGGAGGRFHIYFADRGSQTDAPFAELIRDCICNSGSEVILTTQLNGGGVYRVSAFNFGDQSAASLNLSNNSNAQIQIVRGGTTEAQGNGTTIIGGRTIYTATVPGGQPGNTWVGVEINPANGRITNPNTIVQSEGSSSVR